MCIIALVNDISLVSKKKSSYDIITNFNGKFIFSRSLSHDQVMRGRANTTKDRRVNYVKSKKNNQNKM